MIAILLRIFYNELSDEAGGTSFNAWAKYSNLTARDIDKKPTEYVCNIKRKIACYRSTFKTVSNKN